VFHDEKKHAVMLLDAWCEHIAYPNLRQRIKKEFSATTYGANEQKADIVLIEEKGSGISLVQELRGTGIPVTPYNPGRADKVQRLHTVSNLVYNDMVYIPESKQRKNEFVTWADEFVSQVCSFPLVEHDDYVDTFSQALSLFRDQKWLTVDIDIDEPQYYKKARVNPYAI